MTIQNGSFTSTTTKCCCSVCEGAVSVGAHMTKYAESTFGFHRNTSLVRQSLLDELVGPLVSFTNA